MFFKRFFTTGFICCLLLGCSGTKNEPAPVSSHHYTVQPGDTLYAIAGRFNTSLEELRHLNGLGDEHLIFPGQTLLIAPGTILTTRGRFSGPLPSSDNTLDISHLKHQIGRLCTPLEENRIVSRFGKRGGRFHEGIDINAREGTPVYAVTKGEVIFSGKKNGYGNMVVIKDGSLLTVYAHNSKNLVKKQQIVNAGDLIAKAGSTGNARGPHLHFETRVRVGDGKYVAVNPVAFYPSGKGNCT